MPSWNRNCLVGGGALIGDGVEVEMIGSESSYDFGLVTGAARAEEKEGMRRTRHRH